MEEYDITSRFHPYQREREREMSQREREQENDKRYERYVMDLEYQCSAGCSFRLCKIFTHDRTSFRLHSRGHKTTFCNPGATPNQISFLQPCRNNHRVFGIFYGASTKNGIKEDLGKPHMDLYHHQIKDEEVYRVEEITDRDSNGDRLSPNDHRISKKRTRNWTYDQIMTLIRLWSKEDVLYNVKNPSYHDKDSKNNAINNIVGKLADDGIFVTADEVTNKMHSLRVYFANKRNKLQDSKKTGNGQDDIYKITWPYFESLMFLNDNVVSRSSATNNTKPVNGDGGNMGDNHGNHELTRYETEVIVPPTKSAKKMDPRPVSKGETVIDDDPSILHNGQTNNFNHNVKQVNKSDDEIFCELICRQLTKIPEGASKDFFKLDLYRFVVSNTYRTTSDCNQYSHSS